MARQRFAYRTVLAVGEGKAECVMLERVKALYLPRYSGTRMKIVEGYGKGGRGVLDQAVRYAANASYDLCLAVLDTDTDWNDEQRARARRKRIEVVESVPCLEAWLLELNGSAGERSSAGHKAAFERHFGWPAHDRRAIEACITRELCDSERAQVAALDRLLTLLGC